MIMISGDKLREYRQIGPDAPWILMCGPSAIGKSTFLKNNGFYRAELYLNKAGYNLEQPFIKIAEVGVTGRSRMHIALTSNPINWPNGWYSEKYKINQRAIILGVPYFVYQERIQKRKTRGIQKHKTRKPAKLDWKKTSEEFVQYYKRCVKRLTTNKVPFIFVDNRNDYPILDESSFFTMLKQLR